ncbi:hypothetical protein ACIA6D_27565 [Streptomyces cacaoi]|uniref:hypothetical protein n=1 Tax=Streptomyces cacaoi TaxID=1898 RepID=UPI00374A291D
MGQIQFGLGCITSYRVETDPTRGAWYFPYPFDFTHAEHSGVVYKAPWYSGMARARRSASSPTSWTCRSRTSRATQAPIDMRRRIEGAVVWYRISAGAYEGYWMGEAYPKAFLRGEHVTVAHRVARTLTIAANASVEAIDFGTNSVVGTLKTLKYSSSDGRPLPVCSPGVARHRKAEK